MEEDQTDLIPVSLDEHGTAGVIALLIRVVQLDDELTRDRQIAAEANERVATNSVVRGRAVQAFNVFGFDTSDGLWKRVRAAIGDEAYERAISIAKGREFPLLVQLQDDANDDENDLRAQEAGGGSGGPTPPIRDAILEYLKGLQGAGVTVRDVKQHLLNAYGITAHEKTPGMTLYRLLKEDKVRRDGRVWFYKEPDTSGESHAELDLA